MNKLAIQMLIISAHEQDLFARFSQKVGGHGFIGKQAPPEEFKKALCPGSEGEQFWPQELSAATAAPDYWLVGREGIMGALTLRDMEGACGL